MTVAARFDAGDGARRTMVAKVKIAQKELGLDDGTYRAVLERLTGQTSASACTAQQLGLVLDELKAKGWTPKVFVSGDDKQKPARAVGIDGRRPADSPMAKKARAMWISLHQLGVVRDPSDRALEAFARRQLRVDALQWADQGHAYKLIEALKAMAERAGWSQVVPTSNPNLAYTLLLQSLVKAQCARLGLDPAAVIVQGMDTRATIRDLAAKIHALPLDPEA